MHTQEPWHLKDFVGTHQICAESVDPDSDPVALLSMADYSRSIACVNALAGVPDPVVFVAAASKAIDAWNAGGSNATNSLFVAMENLRTARGPKGVGK